MTFVIGQTDASGRCWKCLQLGEVLVLTAQVMKGPVSPDLLKEAQGQPVKVIIPKKFCKQSLSSLASGPLSRNTATAALPGAEHKAQIVSLYTLLE